MKLIHCADLHLDSKMESIFPTNLAKVRKREILDTFKRMIDYACENDVKAILISGDMFDTSKVQARTKEYIIDLINEHKNIDFLYLCGNHDENNFVKTLDVVPSNLLTFTDNWGSYRYDDIVITGVELNSVNNKVIYTTLDLNENDINIVMLHGQESMYDAKIDADIINLKALENKHIDYLALGHIHSYKVERLDKRGKYIYSGCLEGRGFDECGEKGFVLVEVENKKVKHTFVPFAYRRLHEENVDITGLESLRSLEKAITDKTNSINPDDLVKVNLVGTYTTNTKKDILRFNQLLENKFFFGRVKDKTTIKINIDDYKNDISLTGEFIRTTLQSDESEELKGDIITLGLRALRGEDLE